MTTIVTMTCNRCHARVEVPTVPEAIAWSNTHDQHCPNTEPPQDTP